MKYGNVSLEMETSCKEHENEFEKFYFISMVIISLIYCIESDCILQICFQKNMAKGKDLIGASEDIDMLKQAAIGLGDLLANFSIRLEIARDRIEGAARLHQLLSLNIKADDDVQQEMQKLAEKINDPGLVEKCKENARKNNVPTKTPTTSTPKAADEQNHHHHHLVDHRETSDIDSKNQNHCECWRKVADAPMTKSNKIVRSLTEELTVAAIKANQFRNKMRPTSDDENDDDDEEEHSKLADSGLGYCDQCESNEKMVRSCSCQSFDEPTNASSKR